MAAEENLDIDFSASCLKDVMPNLFQKLLAKHKDLRCTFFKQTNKKKEASGDLELISIWCLSFPAFAGEFLCKTHG